MITTRSSLRAITIGFGVVWSFSEKAVLAPLIVTGCTWTPPAACISPTSLPNPLAALPESVTSITAPPPSAGTESPRTKNATSPIQLRMSSSRSIPYCCCSCARAAAPPNAPANWSSIAFSCWPYLGAPNAAQLSPGSSLISEVVPPRPPRPPNAAELKPSSEMSSASRSPSAVNDPTSGGSLPNGTSACSCPSCAASRGWLCIASWKTRLRSR